MKKVFTLCLLFLSLSSVAVWAQDDDEDLDQTFQFVDADGNIVENGSTVTYHTLEDGEIKINLSIKNTSSDDAAGQMVCDISNMPNGSFGSCAFGSCLPAWTTAGIHNSSSEIMKAGTVEAITTEWVPDSANYAEWTATLQLEELEIVTKTQFGITITQPGTEVIGDGPKITVHLVYSDPTGIQSVEKGQPTVVERYNAAGQRIATATKGLNILRLSNGKTIKQLVK